MNNITYVTDELDWHLMSQHAVDFYVTFLTTRILKSFSRMCCCTTTSVLFDCHQGVQGMIDYELSTENQNFNFRTLHCTANTAPNWKYCSIESGSFEIKSNSASRIICYHEKQESTTRLGPVNGFFVVARIF